MQENLSFCTRISPFEPIFAVITHVINLVCVGPKLGRSVVSIIGAQRIPWNQDQEAVPNPKNCIHIPAWVNAELTTPQWGQISNRSHQYSTPLPPIAPCVAEGDSCSGWSSRATNFQWICLAYGRLKFNPHKPTQLIPMEDGQQHTP